MPRRLTDPARRPDPAGLRPLELATFRRVEHRAVVRGVDAGATSTAIVCGTVRRLAGTLALIESMAATAQMLGDDLDPAEVLDAIQAGR